MQFHTIVKNLIGLKPARKAMFMTTGSWSQRCITEARKFLPEENIIEVTNMKDDWNKMTDPSTWKIDPEASFLHVCMNETIHGVEISEREFPWHLIPKDVVCCGDASSNLGTYEIDYERFGVIYAGAHKNFGPAGTCILVIRKDIMGFQDPDTNALSDWKGNYESTPAIGCAP